MAIIRLNDAASIDIRKALFAAIADRFVLSLDDCSHA
jgi:hypothetical protein